MFSLDSRCFQDTVEFREVQLTALARSFTINFDFYQIDIPVLHVPSTQHAALQRCHGNKYTAPICSMQPICSRQQSSAANIIVTWPLPQVGSEDGMSEYGDTERAGEDGVSIWQELQDETIRLESRKSSSSSQVSKYLTCTFTGLYKCLSKKIHSTQKVLLNDSDSTKEGSLYNRYLSLICRRAPTLWTLPRTSARWRSTWARSRRC